MKKTRGTSCVVVLLFVGLIISPTMGCTFKADITQETAARYYLAEMEELVTVDFLDYTGITPVKNVLKLPESEWTALRNELRTIRTSSESIEESLNAQLMFFKEYNLISDDVTYETLLSKLAEKSKNMNSPRVFNRIRTTPLINNSAFNAMCAIDFELTNGTTAVFGLNTFMNYIGFDILSFHHGYALDGIDTKGVISANTPPGEYVGFMFGFLGYWLGEKIGTGFYSNVTVAGFTVVTAWLSIPVFP